MLDGVQTMLTSISAFRRTIAGAAIAAAFASPLPANAASYVLTATNVDPTAGLTTGPSGPNNTQTYQLTLPLDAFTPFTISNGDDITLTIGFSSAWAVPAGTTQIFGISFLTDPVKLGAGTSAIGSLSINSGSSVFLGECGGCLGFLSTEVPGSTLSIDDLAAFGFLNFDGGDTTLNGILLTYTVENANETPLPAALPLFASGIAALGLVARRRKKKTAAQAAS